MNSIPVLKSKLIMSDLPQNYLLTDRLKGIHRNMASSRAVVVCAPAGYGKTSLTVSYFRQLSIPFRVCWYRLDPHDRNLSVFIAHLVEALFPSESSDFDSSRKALEDVTLNQSDLLYTVSAVCRELWVHHDSSKDTRTYIVLDDFQNVAQVPEACEAMRYMLDNLPPSVSIFILTRTIHDIFSQKQKLEKSILQIGATDLSFNNNETINLMLDLGCKLPDPKLAEAIIKSTEGWIAGILIFYQALKNNELDVNTIESITLTKEEAIFRYLSMEVFKSVDGSTQNSLARLALLQDFSAAEAAEILEIGEVKSLMEQCLEFGMFIQRIPGNPVVYRFHSLFREFLLYNLKDYLPDDEILMINLKAAGYYLRNKTYGRAAEHLILCGNSESAMEMITKAGFNKYMIGETGQLKTWLDLLPDEIVRSNPVLLLFKVQLMPNSRQPEMIETLKKIMKLSLEGGNLVTYYDAASVLIYILMCSNDMRGLSEMTDGFSDKNRDVSHILANTLTILHMVRSIGEERLFDAQAHSESIIYDILPEDSKWLYLILSCIIYYCMGKLESAERCMKTALELYSFKNIEPSRGFILLFLSTVQLLKNERINLKRQITEVLSIGEKYDYDYLIGHAKRLAAFERYLTNDTKSAIALLEEATYHFQRIKNKAMAAACRLLRHLWSIGINSSAPDVHEALKELNIIQRSSPGLMVYESSLSVFGAIAREAGDFSNAEKALLSAIEQANAKKGLQVLFGAYNHIAKLYFVKGDYELGRQYLRKAIELGAANKYYMFWDIHMPTLLEMALRSIRYGYYTDYIGEFLGKFYEANAVKYLSERIKSIDDGFVAEFSYGFASRYKPHNDSYYFVKATLFGKPEIWINGLKIADTEWKTKKVKGLLEYLLLFSGGPVSKEVLAEVFWPESDARSAFASQRTALYNLRKVLAKYGVKVEGKNAFIEETLEGLQIKRTGDLEVDVHRFLSLNDKLVRLKDEPLETEEEIDVLKRIVDIYKGELLEGSDYGDRVFHERERLMTLFISACRRLGSLYAQSGAFGQAEEILKRVLLEDPYNEEICLDLLKAYMFDGKHSRAVKFYYKFKNRLEHELGIKADKRLSDAIRVR